MTTTYTKSLAADFGGILNQRQLHKEIINDVGITPNLIGVMVTGDVVDITFDSALSAGEQTTLNGIISSYTAIITTDTTISSTTTFSTTLSTWQTKSELDTQYLNARDYKISWFYIFCTENPTPNIRIILDDTITIHTNNQQTPINSSTYEFNMCGFTINTLTEGQHNIKLQCIGEKTASVTIKEAYMHIMEV